MSSDKQIHANRENAKLSLGPVTDAGKAISSHNAVKTGLTGQTVLLKTDDVAAYNRHVQRFLNKFQPVGDDESDLLQDLADTEWRLLRITPLESGILALGRLEIAPEFASETDLAYRDQLIESKVFLTYRRDLANLSLQQGRLRKHRGAVIEELKTLQRERKDTSRTQASKAAFYLDSQHKPGQPFHMADFGFDFTLDDLVREQAVQKAMRNNDRFPEVTKKGYQDEYRAEYHRTFGKQ